MGVNNIIGLKFDVWLQPIADVAASLHLMRFVSAEKCRVSYESNFSQSQATDGKI